MATKGNVFDNPLKGAKTKINGGDPRTTDQGRQKEWTFISAEKDIAKADGKRKN